MENTNSKMHKMTIVMFYRIELFKYLFAPIILPLLVWILAEEPTSEHGKSIREPCYNVDQFL